MGLMCQTQVYTARIYHQKKKGKTEENSTAVGITKSTRKTYTAWTEKQENGGEERRE